MAAEEEAAAQEAEGQEEGEGEEEKPAKEEKKKAEFDTEAFLAKWDEEVQPIEIPVEVIDDIDNDFNLDIEHQE